MSGWLRRSPRTVHRLAVLFVCLLLMGGCRVRDDLTPPADPFEIELLRGATWSAEHPGYDPALPGYRLDGEMGTILLRPRPPRPPDRLVFAIRTSRGMPPNLESFSAITADRVLRSSFFQGTDRTVLTDRAGHTLLEPPPGTFLRMERAGDEIQVTFLPEAMPLLRSACRISWVDWYRH